MLHEILQKDVNFFSEERKFVAFFLKLILVKFCFIYFFLMENQSLERASFWTPNPAQTRNLLLKPYLGLKAKFTEWVKICANAGICCIAE